MIFYSFLVAALFHPSYEDGDQPPAGDPPSIEDGSQQKPTGDVGTGQKPSGRTFSQEEVNRLLAEDRRKHQEQIKKALGELEAIRAKAKLTQEERDELDHRIQQMREELMTKEELAKQEKERLKRSLETQLKSVSEERDSWKNRYTTSAIKRSITDAAVVNGAYNPTQIVALLQSNTRLVEKLDEAGNPTGEFIPKVRFEDTDKDGKPVVLDLSPEEAVKRMKDQEQYFNLFKGEGVGGLGSHNQPVGKKADPRTIARDPARYREARRKGEIKF